MEDLNQLATKLQDRADNKADAKRGEELLASGERITIGELRPGDIVLGAGEVTYAHVYADGKQMRLGIGEGETKICRVYATNIAVTIKSRSEAGICPRCCHVNHKNPVHVTHEGAAEFYCDGCEMPFKDFDFGNEDEDPHADEIHDAEMGHP